MIPDCKSESPKRGADHSRSGIRRSPCSCKATVIHERWCSGWRRGMFLSDTAERKCCILFTERVLWSVLSYRPRSKTLLPETGCIKRPMFHDGLALTPKVMCVAAWAVPWLTKIVFKHNYCKKALIWQSTKFTWTEGFKRRSKQEETKQEFRVQETE